MSRSGDFCEYRLTDALTRHIKVGPKSSLEEDVVVAVRDPQFLELRWAAVDFEAAASDSAGESGRQTLRESGHHRRLGRECKSLNFGPCGTLGELKSRYS